MTNASSRHAYSPERAVANTLEVIQDRIDNPNTGIRQHIPGLGGVLNPWRAGELIGILGYTSNGKTSLVNYIVTQHAHAIQSWKADHEDYNHVNLYVTWEQSIEEQTIVDLSRVTAISANKIFKGELTVDELQTIMGMGADNRRKLPVWLMGHSIKDDRQRPRLSMKEVLDAVCWIEEQGIVIDMIVLDYLQRIKRVKSDLREGFMDVVDSAKDLAMRCPVILLSQAKREVTSREFALPELDDSQETSNFEQSCDQFLSVWMPKQKYKIGDLLPFRGVGYTVTDKLLVLGILKQKMGDAPIYRFYEMGYGGIYLDEVKTIDLNKEANGGKKTQKQSSYKTW